MVLSEMGIKNLYILNESGCRDTLKKNSGLTKMPGRNISKPYYELVLSITSGIIPGYFTVGKSFDSASVKGSHESVLLSFTILSYMKLLFPYLQCACIIAEEPEECSCKCRVVSCTAIDDNGPV